MDHQLTKMKHENLLISAAIIFAFSFLNAGPPGGSVGNLETF